MPSPHAEQAGQKGRSKGISQTHASPSECIASFDFQHDIADSVQYWEDIMKKDRWEARGGDCSVIAASLALRQGCIVTASELETVLRSLKPSWSRIWWQHLKAIGPKRLMLRPRLLLQEIKHYHKRWDPIYGTLDEVLDVYLCCIKPLFQMVYGEEGRNLQTCICDNDVTYVVTGRLPKRDFMVHASAIVDGVIRCEYDLRLECFQVLHVWKMHSSIGRYW